MFTLFVSTFGPDTDVSKISFGRDTLKFIGFRILSIAYSKTDCILVAGSVPVLVCKMGRHFAGSEKKELFVITSGLFI